MNGFGTYAAELASLALRASTSAVNPDMDAAAAAALNGDAAAHLRSLVSLSDRRAVGAFFTSSSLAERAWSQLTTTLDANSVILDPTCGAGSLLLPAIPNLAKFASSTEDLASRIYGIDLHSEFTQAARARLALSLVQVAKTNPTFTTPSSTAFKNVRRGDLYSRGREFYGRFTHLAINPPYTMHTTPEWFDLSSGKVNSAALMISYCLDRMRPGAQMIAILPDVLKSGTRYERWRSSIQQQAVIEDINPVGQFDEQTDVHVFLLQLRKLQYSRAGTTTELDFGLHQTKSTTIVSDLFTVSVGAVVQHRHREEGHQHPFAHAKGLQGTINSSELPTRRFSGRCDQPPFVVVRRTSRPGEPTRARSSIIIGPEPVAVDNHLIVLSPHDRSIESCRSLAAHLQLEESTRWLDNHFRCRHLTVGALASLPFSSIVQEARQL